MKPALSRSLIQSLVCPETRQALREAAPDELAKLQQRAREGGIITRDDRRVESSFDGILIREDGKIGYLVVSGIPVLLNGEGVLLPTS